MKKRQWASWCPCSYSKS